MGKAITDSSFKLAKTLISTGVEISAIADAIGTSTTTVYLIKDSEDMEDYKQKRDKRLKTAFESRTTQIKTTSEPAQSMANSLVDAVIRVAEAVEKNNEQLAKLVDAWNNKASE